MKKINITTANKNEYVNLVAWLEKNGVTVRTFNKAKLSEQTELFARFEEETKKTEEEDKSSDEEPKEEKKKTPLDDCLTVVTGAGFEYTVTKDKPHVIVKKNGFILRLQPSKNGCKVRCNKKFSEIAGFHTEYHTNWSTPFSVGENDEVDYKTVLERLVELTTEEKTEQPKTEEETE